MPELLSPAGNPEKLMAAVRYGADAVYLAGQMFGMRAAAENFSLEELKYYTAYCHERGVRVYLTVNTMPREHEYPYLRTYLESIRDFGIDAFIVADIGVMAVLRSILPDAVIHVSTQACSVSSESIKAWHALGARRVVLARELTMKEIRAIRENTPKEIELEAFIHGSMCVSYSGRCLLSNHFTGRDGNRGMCAQPCRWNYSIRGYEIVEEKRENMPLPVLEENGETFIMSSRDTCMIEHIPELMESGIDSFKIEGRIKSAYYTAVVTNAYRMAMDAYTAGNYQYNPDWYRELISVSHRDYGTGYYYGDSHEFANLVENAGYIRDKAYLATVDAYDAITGRATLIQRNKFSVGDTVEVVSPGKTGRPFVVESIEDDEGNPIDTTPHPLMHFSLPIPFAVFPGDIIRSTD